MFVSFPHAKFRSGDPINSLGSPVAGKISREYSREEIVRSWRSLLSIEHRVGTRKLMLAASKAANKFGFLRVNSGGDGVSDLFLNLWILFSVIFYFFCQSGIW